MKFYSVEYLETNCLPICSCGKQHNFLTSLPSNSESSTFALDARSGYIVCRKMACRKVVMFSF